MEISWCRSGGCVTLLLLWMFVLGTISQDLNPYCERNQCTNGETCLLRSANAVVNENHDYVCECDTNGPGIQNAMGYRCTENGVHRQLFTCYGVQCQESSFQSPNFPNIYEPRDTILFLLYIPFAMRIDFTFDSLFHIELYKDELYVGVGLEYQQSQLNFRSEPPNKYFFEGDMVPEDFSLHTDTAWIFFLTDRNVEYSGFRISWTANVDQEPPTVTSCPTEEILGMATVGINEGVIVTWTEPTAEDSIGPVRVEQSFRSGDFFPIGTTTVEYVFYDEVNNAAYCSFNVTVIGVDVTQPVINNCPSFIFQQVPLGSGGASVSWVEPSAEDDSGTAILAQRSHTPGSVFQPGVVDVVYAFSDPSGNEATCTFRVTVEEVDRELPIISNCPRNVVENIDVGAGGTIIDWQDPDVSDNSGQVTLVSQSHTAGSFFLPGTSRVAYVYEDPSLNRAVCSFTITIIEVDTISPVVQCIDDITISITLNIGGARVDWVEPVATDNSGFVTLTSKSHEPGAFFPPGERTVTYVFTDAARNTAECSFTVTVTEVDSELPVVTCPPDIRKDIPLGSGGVTIHWDEPQVSDNSGNVILIYQSHRSGNFFPTGFIEVVYMYRDPAANTVECSFFIRIIEVDTVPPAVACTADISQVIPIGSGGVVVSWTEPVATDNSGSVELTVKTHSPGTLFETGSTVVMYVYEDPSGNSASCKFNVTVIEVDDSPPDVMQCPDDIMVDIDLAEGGAIVNWTEPTVTDNSGVVILSLQTHLSGSYFAPGISSVTYLYEDAAGNGETCTFTVSVVRVDTTPPRVICPEDVHLTILTGMGGSGISWVEPTVADNSGNAFLRSQTHISGQYFEIGNTVVTYLYADFSDNEQSCSFTVRLSEANPCALEPCYNGGLCVIDSVTDYMCLCQECFEGEQCEIELDACSNHLCENGGTCMSFPGSCAQYFCECSDCNTGQYCEQAIDPCENHQCQNGGRCLQDASSCSTYSCQCTSCFTGEYCQEILDPCLDHQCQNLGTCLPLSSGACSGYVCECPSCFTGLYCGERYSLCDLNPCRNGGTCFSGSDSCFLFKCICPTCWTGYMCEIPVPSQCEYGPCMNGGTCTSVAGACDQYMCTCPPGFTGVNCEIGSSINENACTSGPCVNGGSCLTMDGDHYVCLCPPDYVGIDCGTVKANFLIYDACRNFPCEGTATCYNSYNSLSTPQGVFTKQYTCVCPPRYTGRNCGEFTENAIVEDVCSLGIRAPCQNGGLCMNAYHNFDRLVDYVCVCPEGWAGHNCETPYTSACDSSPCQNEGICTSIYEYFSCTCPPGYLGTTCEINVVDIVPPIVSNCPPSMTISAGEDINSTVSWTEPHAIDNSGSVSLYRQTHSPNDVFNVGTTAVTYIFVDPSFNAASCTFFVTVTSRAIDTSIPTIRDCPNDITVTAPTGLYTAMVRWEEPTAIDNSGEPLEMTRNFYPGNQFPLGDTTVEYTFTDPSGNEAVCAFVITVVLIDNISPVLTYCPDNIEQLITSGALFVTIEWERPTATDESGFANLTYSTLSSESLFVRVDGTPFEVVYEFTDPAGNTVTCSFTVSAISSLPDTLPPVITGCPSDILVTIRPGSLTGTAVWTEPTAVDDSNRPPSISRTHPPGAQFPVGDTVVSYLFSDSAGNREECAFVVTVTDVDVTPPVITGCPVDTLTLTSPPGTIYASIEWDKPTAKDDTGPALLVSESGPRSPTFIRIGETGVVEYVFADLSGNQATCRFTISAIIGIPDSTPPVISGCPQDLSVTVPPSGTFSTTATWPEPTAFDDSGHPPTLTKSHEPGLSQFPVGDTLVTYRYRDAARNDAVCHFTVTVHRVDNTSPVISGCPADQTLAATFGGTAAIATWVPPTATDDITTDLTVDVTDSPGRPFPVGDTTVRYTFTDDAGNAATCTFTITVTEDTTPPVISGCPADQTLAATIGNNEAAIAQWDPPSATDDTTTDLAVDFTNSPGRPFPVGDHIISYTFTDDAGNAATCNFTITVTVDTTPPVISGCPADQTLAATIGNNEAAIAQWVHPTATDDITTDLTVDFTNSPGRPFPVGDHIISYTFTDDAGNAATCNFTITVTAEDTTRPVISGCPADQTLAATFGGTAAIATWVPPTATDDTTTDLTVDVTDSPGRPFPVGDTTVRYTFTDDAGNAATCTFTIAVTAEDITPPVINGCPADQTLPATIGGVAAIATWAPPTATDDISTDLTVDVSSTPGRLFPVGDTIVSYTFTDDAGNVATCTFTITVTAVTVDTTPPVISDCPADQTLVATFGGTAAIATWVPPTATDDVTTDLTVDVTDSPGRPFPVGDTTVRYTFTDDAGNAATCTFTITVTAIDETPPVISGCPANITASSTNGNSVSVVWIAPTASDNSGEEPVLIALPANQRPGNLFPIGDTQITYRFVDSAGNEAVCNFTVTVTTDNPPPPSNPCASSPCNTGEQCYQYGNNYLCQNVVDGNGRKRRDLGVFHNVKDEETQHD